ncbi:hypothetical protein ABPG77_004246 [Micractinium sp. CCAP 211/92]
MAPAPEAEHVCAAFAACFFGAADDAVVQYVQQSLLTAAEDGSELREQAEALQDFLPPGGSTGALAAGLAELDQVLRDPSAEHTFGWLHADAGNKRQGAAQQARRQAGAGTGAGAAAAAADAAAGAEPPQAAGAAGEQQPLAAGRAMPSSLRAGAAEFRPGAQAASLPAQLSSLQLHSEAAGTAGAVGSVGAATAGASWPEGSASGFENGEQESDSRDGDWPGWDAEQAAHNSSQQPHPAGRWAAAAAAAEVQAAAGGGVAASAFLAVLADQFPLWSAEALRQLFEEQACDLAATVSTLCSLESELEGQQQAGSMLDGSSCAGAACSTQAAFTADDFPSLSGSAAASGSSDGGGRGMAGSARGGYASAAAAAADLPGERTKRGAFSRPPRRGGGSAAPAASTQPQLRAPSAAAAAGQQPAPIWQQDEGVARFATGQALAAQYAELRADARDHARLRNAFFQQATQAYMAGNRRLAKELGAKGRWHNEQMHAAHAAASAQLFTERNAGGAARGGATGRGSDVRTVDLHGLHVSEALDRVDALLAEIPPAAGAAGRRRLRLVVGEGRHAAGAARLPAGVKRYLDSRGVTYAEPYAGLLELRL